MSFSDGIVGLPNVGKSTLFSALTKAQVDCANYPFCTIEPNKAIVAVPDERLNKLAQLEKSEKVLPTTIEFVDIAGLVAGAHKGEGLGNKFLSHIREVDAIVHLVRAFENPDIAHVSGKVEPVEDKKTILLELILADLEYVQKVMEGLIKKTRTDKEAKIKLEAYRKIEQALSSEKLASEAQLSEEEKKFTQGLQLLTNKPIITIANTETNDAEIYIGGSEKVMAINVKLEQEISSLTDIERIEYIKELGLPESGLNRLVHAAYRTLNLITFITAGPKETRAWTVVSGTKAPQAAGKIHSDFERGFIKAEVIPWHRLLETGGYTAAREKGWLRLEGKNYVIQDGDVVHFKFNV